MTVLCAGVLALGALSLLRSAAHSDHLNALEETRRAEHAISLRTNSLTRQAMDWSMWDDTYEFAETRDPAYVEANLYDEVMEDLGLNLLAIYDEGGQPTYVSAYDLDEGAPHSDPAHDSLLATVPQLNMAGKQGAANGIAHVQDQRPMLIGAAPILRSDRSGPTRGTLVMGRFLDDSELAAISEETQLALKYVESIPGQKGATTRTIADAVVVTSPLEVIGHADGGALELRIDRKAWREAVRGFTFFGVGLLIVLSISLFALSHGLNSMVLNPIERLSEGVRRIRRTGRPLELEVGRRSQPVKKHDELTALAGDIEKMAQALDDSRAQVEHARQGLEHRVEERTAELRSAMEAQHASEQRYRSLIENLTDVVFVINSEGEIEYASPSISVTLGYEQAEVIGGPLAVLLDRLSSESLAHRFRRGFSETGDRIAVKALARDGDEVEAEIVLTPVGDGSGNVQGILRDVTAQKRHESELLHIASHDFLTGLYNRRRFEEELGRHLAEAQRRESSGAILWFDLDGFKDINDTLGHQAGDVLLVAVAQRLSERVRSESILARLGGDEFAVLLPGADEGEARQAAERLLKEISSVTVQYESTTVRTTASLGIVVYPEAGTEVEDLLARADIAMYHAKELGRSKYKVYEVGEEWRSDIEDRRTWIEQIELALLENGLIAYAQPIIDVETGRIVSHELLVRMRSLEGEPIPPGRFLPIAERVGLIVDIDLWMLHQAVTLLAESPDQQSRININMSPRTLADDQFMPRLESEFGQLGVDPARLTVELTETAIIHDVASAKDVVRRIRGFGCRVSLDDFGSGFTSFMHLKQLGVDEIKIDGSFVQGIVESDNDQHLVRAMVEMAKGLSMSTTAEFVESLDSLDLLRTYGCENAQGFALGRPSPASEMETSPSEEHAQA